MTAQSFTWVPFYQELAKKLSGWEKRQEELISFLETLRTEGYVITPLNDKDINGARFLLKEIDPFTFFGVFNRGIRFDQRLAILVRMKGHFELQSELPEDFNGIPVLNNLKSWFFPYQASRDINDVGRLWRVFQLALEEGPLGKKQFLRAFDEALTVKQTNVNLTMGLFWIRPDAFLNLDQVNRSHLGIKLPSGGLNAKFYTETVQRIRVGKKSFPEISLEAWGAGNERAGMVSEPKGSQYRTKEEINYWLVGAYWNDREPADQTERFLAEGIWENGYYNRYISEVMSMRERQDCDQSRLDSTQRPAL
jgi:5-methylcytosine-specific restriction protein B